MLSILSLDNPADTHESRVPTREEESVVEFVASDSATPPPAVPDEEAAESTEDFEIVMGRRQIASVLFVATVIVAIFSSVSYLAGKSIGPKKAASDNAPTISLTPTPAENALPAIPTITATIAPAPAATTHSKTVGPQNPMDGPLFAEPVVGSVYIQMAAVEKGIAMVFAEGLRRHGLESFVAPGPSENLHRVLIGPLANPAAYAVAKEELDRIGLTTFARKYQK